MGGSLAHQSQDVRAEASRKHAGASLGVSDQDKELFLQACCHGDISAVKVLMRKVTDQNHYTALVDTLCNKDGMYGTHLACEYGRVEVLRLLLCYNADLKLQTSRGNTPLHIACRTSKAPECVREILFGAHGDWAQARLIWVGRRKGGPQCPFYHIPADVARILTRMVMAGACNPFDLCSTINNEGRTPLDLAINIGQHESIGYVLQALRTRPEQLLRLLNTGFSDVDGACALHRAASASDAKCVGMLLRAGAQVNTLNKRHETPLFRACCAVSQKADVVEALLAAGADRNIRDRVGRLPVDEARARGYSQIVAFLS